MRPVGCICHPPPGPHCLLLLPCAASFPHTRVSPSTHPSQTTQQDLSPEYSRYCACDAGWGSWGCQLQLLSLPLNAPEPVTATIPPGKWGYWEVTLPAWQGQGPMGGPSDAAAGRGSSGGSGGGGSNEQLLLMAERVPGPGMGGNPLLFLKPFDNKVGRQEGSSTFEGGAVLVGSWC